MPSYDFSQLSPFDFEMLTHGLLEREWGIRLEAFKSGRDRGIDLRYSSPFQGKTTIVQCKHYVTSGYSKLLHHLKHVEVQKVAALQPDRYVIVTSIGLTPDNKSEIQLALAPHILTTDDIIGQTEINLLLTKHPEIEQSNFKLWLTSKAVLDRVLHNAELCQTEFAVEKIRKRLPLYVQNDCYPRATDILKKSNVVIISGEPGVGKTTLAEIILYSHLNNGWNPIVIKSDLKEGRSLYNKAAKQVFYYDDFLGQTFLGDRHNFLLRNEDASLVEFIEMIQSSENAKLIMTTREHILSNALIGSERLRRSPLLDHRSILRMADYGRIERARILYNHIYFSELPGEYISALINEGFYEKILRHRNFNPRLIEWLSSYRRVTPIEIGKYRSFVMGILERPQEIWSEAFRNQISDHSRSLLLALFSLGGKTILTVAEAAWRELSAFQARKYNYRLSTEGITAVFRELEGSFISINQGHVEFINPSVKDFIAAEVAAKYEYLEDLIQGAATFQQLFTLWQWDKQLNAPTNRSVLSTASSAFFNSIERTLAQPYRRLIQAADGIAEQALDLLPEARMMALLRIAIDMESERLMVLVPSALAAILERWSEVLPDFEETTNILDDLEDDPFCLSLLDENIHETLRRRMLSELSNSISFYDFFHVEDYSLRTDRKFSDEENELFSSSFHNYLKSWFSNELSEISTSDDQLDDMATFISRMREDYGYNVESELDRVTNSVAERDHMAQLRADHDYDHWKDQRGSERFSDDTISSMFDSLK